MNGRSVVLLLSLVLLVETSWAADPAQSGNSSAKAGPSSTPEGQPIVSRKPGETRQDNGLNQKLGWCPPGKFKFGSPKSEPGRSDGPREDQVLVTFGSGFWLAQTSVTQDQYRSVMGGTPWKGKELVNDGPNFPAVYVNWDEAKQFCQKLTDAESKAGRLEKGWMYALPTEAQREYACRAGTETAYSFGDDPAQLIEYAWCARNADHANEKFAHEVGKKKPNPWGIFDLHGNVHEWCRDFYSDRLPFGADPFNAQGTLGVIRGGSWRSREIDCRSAARIKVSPAERDRNVGFRIALVPAS